MTFEKFKHTGGKFFPKISIRPSGQIGFSRGALKRFGIDKYEFVVLFYDRELKKIGVELTNDDKAEGAAKLIVKSDNGTVSAKSFFRYFGIDFSKKRSFDLINEDGKLAAYIYDNKG